MKKLLLSVLTITAFGFGANAQIYVNLNATGSNSGTSWTNAYTNLNVAMNSAIAGDTIWVAGGIYIPDRSGTDTAPPNPRDKKFSLNNKDLYLYGGFNGTETQLSERDLVINPTVLSGDIGVQGDITDNCYDVFLVFNSNFVLDGFSVSDGDAEDVTTGFMNTKGGAGIFIWDDEGGNVNSSRISNCIIKDNIARAEAGILFILNNNTAIHTILVENTRFTGNKARWAAAFSMFVYDGTLNPTFVNCLIDNNITDEINGESGATQPGGRFVRYTNGALNGKIINCTFTKNIEYSGLADNAKSVFGIGGPNNTTEIHNSIFWDNNVNTTNSTLLGSNASVTVYNTISEDTMSNTNCVVATTNNTHVAPLFTNPTIDDFTLQSASSAINSGDTTGISHLIPTSDLNNGSRIIDNIIDLGCYETCPVIDIATSSAGLTITATQTGVSYQWLDCNNNNAIIPNETLQSFTGTANGNYACEITNDCSIDTTACVTVTGVGINEQTTQKINVYPNPVSNQLIVDFDGEISNISIIELTGKTINSFVSASHTIDVSRLVNGIYFLQVQTADGLISETIN